AKNPAQRYETLADMAQAVESIGRLAAVPEVRPAVPGPIVTRTAAREARRAAEPVPVVTPAPPVSLRGQVGELSGSLAMAAGLALLTTTLWAAVLREGNLYLLGPL